VAGEQKSIIVVGLGPASWEDLTLAASEILTSARTVICRTLRHPTVEALVRRRPELVIESFDWLYESAGSFSELYPRMVDELLARAKALADGETLIYAVPGHPLIAEESVRLLQQRAQDVPDIALRIIAGLSFIEPVCAALRLDPLERHLQLVDATLLADVPAPEMMGMILPTHPLLIAQAYNRRLASGVKLALSELYPDDWEVVLVRAAGATGGQEAVIHMPLLELDRGEYSDHLTTLYVPPLQPLCAVRVPEGLRTIVQRLRAPEGCPWDREQTHQSLRRYVLEEAYEVVEILDEWDGTPQMAEKLAEELGDLLLQVYLQAEIADQEDLFHIGDVYQAVSEKLIRRHPHVFGETAVRDAAHVARNWETIKREERAARGEDVAAESILLGIPRGAPALFQAHELGRKAARVGFDWISTEDALSKVAEEAHELTVAESQEEQRRELGDLLLALATLARHLKIEPEEALRQANGRFRRRFFALEERARREGRDLAALDQDDWLRWWNQAKDQVSQPSSDSD
jgi:tetrapyrrole methylase family protein / MazG family protein